MLSHIDSDPVRRIAVLSDFVDPQPRHYAENRPPEEAGFLLSCLIGWAWSGFASKVKNEFKIDSFRLEKVSKARTKLTFEAKPPVGEGAKGVSLTVSTPILAPLPSRRESRRKAL
jgi:hypothetical protein